jgi:hypothetical protein
VKQRRKERERESIEKGGRRGRANLKNGTQGTQRCRLLL